MLFALHINDIFRVKLKGITLAYADDKALIFKAKSWKQLQKLVLQELERVLDWFSTNKLVVNIKKTNFMLFGCYRDSLLDSSQIQMRRGGTETTIQWIGSMKYLGIHIDSNLSGNFHIEAIKERTRHLFRKIRPYTKNRSSILLSSFMWSAGPRASELISTKRHWFKHSDSLPSDYTRSQEITKIHLCGNWKFHLGRLQ